MQDQEIDDVNVAPNQKFCMILLQYLHVDRQSTGDQFPKLRHSIAWLATKMKKKKFTHVCKKMTETMRPIMTRLKKEGGDETLLLYAETNRVELFELMHLRQTYPGKLEEEKQKVWFTLNVLAQIIGHANIQNNAAVAPILRRAAALAEPSNSSNPMSDVDRVGNLVRSMVTDVGFGHQLKESLTSLIADPDRTSVIMDIMENSGLVNYEQRTRAENKFQKKKKADNAVTLHTASSDGSCQEEKLAAIETVDEINEIANNMLANKKKFSSIEDFTASFGADDQNENSETKPQRGIGDVLAETMMNVPEKNPEDMLPFLDLLSKNAEEDLQTKCELSNAASMLVTGNYKGLMENLGTIVTKLNKGSDGTSEANQEQESLPNPFADLGPDTDLSHVMQRLHNLTTDTFDDYHCLFFFFKKK